MNARQKKVVKWIVYIALLLLFYTLQTTAGLFQIKGIRPILLVSMLVSVSFIEEENTACAIGILGGLLWDLSTGKIMGYSAIVLMVLCIAVSLLGQYFFRVNILNVLLLCAGFIFIYYLIDFIFVYAIWGYNGLGYIALNKLFTSIYTIVATIPIFFIIKKINQKLRR